MSCRVWSTKCCTLWLHSQCWGKFSFNSINFYPALFITLITLVKFSWEIYLLNFVHLYVFFQCLANPHKPQYGGGVIVNPELNEGLKGWSSFGNAKIQHRESKGNKFIVALGRNQQHASVSQKVSLQSGKLYTFSGTRTRN